MKKLIILFLLFIAVMPFSISADSEITVTIDGERIYFNDAPPVIVNDRTYVPMRAIFESMGAYVEWDNDMRCVFAHKRLSHINMYVDEGIYYVNSDKFTMVAEPLLINDRLMLPVRDVSEALGAEVVWSAVDKTVIISSVEETYDIDDMYLEFWKKHNDVILLTGVAAYPHINDEVQIKDAFNEFILGECEAYADKVSLEYFDAAAAMLEMTEDKASFMPFMFERSFDITYDKDSTICILFKDEVYADGVIPCVNFEAMTYDMNTGRLLEAWDIMEETEAEIRKKVRMGFIELVMEKHNEFFTDAIEILDESPDKLCWFLKDDGVHFFINPGIIAPASYGVVEIIL